MARTFDTPIHTSDQSIDRVLAAGLPVVMVFVNSPAPANLTDAMNRIAREQAGKLFVVEVPAKDSPQSMGRFGVQNTPAVVTFRDGKAQTKSVSITAADLEEHVNYLLGKGPRPAERQPAHASQQAGYTQGPSYQGARQASSASGYSKPGYTSSAAGSSGHPFPVNDASFDQEVMGSQQPVLVDFWAPWCGPCRMAEPILEKLAHEMSGRLKVAKVNVDENPMSAGRYGVQAVPTMMLVKNGRIIDRWAGVLPEASLRTRLANHI